MDRLSYNEVANDTRARPRKRKRKVYEPRGAVIQKLYTELVRSRPTPTDQSEDRNPSTFLNHNACLDYDKSQAKDILYILSSYTATLAYYLYRTGPKQLLSQTHPRLTEINKNDSPFAPEKKNKTPASWHPCEKKMLVIYPCLPSRSSTSLQRLVHYPLAAASFYCLCSCLTLPSPPLITSSLAPST